MDTEKRGVRADLGSLWDWHTRCEFKAHDIDATMDTMTDDPYLVHVPTLTGGSGKLAVAEFYARHFIPKIPHDAKMTLISRTVGSNRVVDEFILSFTHDREMDFMLPGIAPTGRFVQIPTVAIVSFEGEKIASEHVYWDQACVLVQLGLLEPDGLPVVGMEAAGKLLDKSLPENGLIEAAEV